MSTAFKQWHQVVQDLVVHLVVSQSQLLWQFLLWQLLWQLLSVGVAILSDDFSDHYCDLCDRDVYNLLNSWLTLPR